MILGESSGAGVIFGNTGGVIEAACRTAYELHTGKTLESGVRSTRHESSFRHGRFDGLPLRIGIAHGLGNARKLPMRREGRRTPCREIMACPGGCIGGGDSLTTMVRVRYWQAGRQPSTASERLSASARESINHSPLSGVPGEPGSHKAHSLLHTKYFPKTNEVTINSRVKRNRMNQKLNIARGTAYMEVKR